MKIIQRRSDLLQRALLAILFTYGVLGGATGGGILTPQYRWLTLAFLTLIAALWLLVRWPGGWVWYRTPLDAAFLLWIAAIIIALLANMEAWRRIVIGLWFALAYLGLWYLLYDSLANGGLKRSILIEGMLFGGLVVMIFGYIQFFGWLLNWLTLASSGAPPAFELPRLASTLDNPNFLATFFVILVPLAISYLLSLRNRAARLLLGLYIILGLGLLLLTDSRSGWIAAAVGLLTLLILLLAHNRMLSAAQLRAWWRAQSMIIKLALAGAVLLIVVIGGWRSLALVRSLSDPGRALDQRTYLFSAALQMFREKPLTGYGLFTFGRGLMQLASIPPLTPHNTAHDLFLSTAAEMGLPGLLALIVSLLLLVWAMWRNWQSTSGAARLVLAGAIAACAGVFVDHLPDYTTTASPLVAICAVSALVLATAPAIPIPAFTVQRRLQPILLAGMWAALLIVGFGSTALYSEYVAALRYGSQSGDYAGATARLETLIQTDPTNPMDYLYEGYFLGMAANGGDPSAAARAISAFAKFCALEPYYAPAWVDLAALYWQTDQRDQAIQAMRRAAQLAPDAWYIWYALGSYQETAGDSDGARAAYTDALRLYPDAPLYPEWNRSDLRREMGNNTVFSPQAQVVSALDSGRIDQARQLWDQLPSDQRNLASSHVIGEVVALALKDRQTAEAQLNAAKRAPSDPLNPIWIHLGMVRLAAFDSDPATANRESDTAHALLAAYATSDADRISAISYAQFWNIGLPQNYLPGIFAPSADAVLTNLLDRAPQ